MAKEWEVLSDYNGAIHSARRKVDGERFHIGKQTFHGPIKRLYVDSDEKMWACFEDGDAFCEIELTQIKRPDNN